GFEDAADGFTAGWFTGGALRPLKRLWPTYRSAPTTTTAATPIRIFLLPPPLVSGTLAPPKVNVGAGLAEESLVSALADVALGLRTSFSATEGTGISAAAGDFASRAGAAALAAPPPNDGAGADVAEDADAARGASGAGLDAGLASAAPPGIVAAGAAGGVAGRNCGAGGAIAAAFLAAGGAMVGTGAAAGTGMSTEVAGVAAGAALGLAAMGCAGTGIGFAAGAAGRCVGGVGVVATGAAGFAASPFLSSPRATRRVPLACSTLMGLVRTRLAPMRKAFATPA